MKDVYYLTPGSCEEFYFYDNPFDKDKADALSFGGEFTLDLECREILNERLTEIIYGDRIRKTTERLNNEWLKKMWKASDGDFQLFWFEQIRKRFEEHEDQN